MTDPAALRADYTRGNLDETDIADSWYPQLRLWFDTAAADPSVLEANAIQLATVDASGRPLQEGIEKTYSWVNQQVLAAQAEDEKDLLVA